MGRALHLFDLKKTDWGKVVEANRSKVTSNTTHRALRHPGEDDRAICDTHTFLAAPEIRRRFQTLRPGTDRVVKGGFQHSAAAEWQHSLA